MRNYYLVSLIDFPRNPEVTKGRHYKLDNAGRWIDDNGDNRSAHDLTPASRQLLTTDPDGWLESPGYNPMYPLDRVTVRQETAFMMTGRADKMPWERPGLKYRPERGDEIT